MCCPQTPLSICLDTELMLMHLALLSQDTFTTRRTTSELVFNGMETEIILHFFQVSPDCGRVSTVAAGFLPDEEDKHCPTWRGRDSQVLLSFKTIFLKKNHGNIIYFDGTRCTYNSTGVNHETHIGGTAGDEMCNLYIMYFTGTFHVFTGTFHEFYRYVSCILQVHFMYFTGAFHVFYRYFSHYTLVITLVNGQ